MKVPQFGEIISYSVSDAIGRIRLDDGSEVRFGASALKGLVPVVGLQVMVKAVTPHPLGGHKATELTLAEREEATYQEKAKAFETVVHAEKEASWLKLEEDHRRLVAALEPDPLTDEEAQELARIREQREADRLARRQAAVEIEQLGREARTLLKDRTGPAFWIELLRKAGLSGVDVTKILHLARPAARLVARPPAIDLGRGASKLGGDPDLPSGFNWPRFKDRPLSFLGQIGLSAVPAGVCQSLSLQPDGWLSFFYDAQVQPWGFDPADRGAARVFLSKGTEPLVRVTAPSDLAKDWRFRELEIQFREETSLPASDSPGFVALALDGKTVDAYLAALAAYEGVQESPPHLLGGHAMPIQVAMEEECALVAHGINTGDRVNRSKSEFEAILRESLDWRLLLQLDSDEAFGSMWGDCGMLYFWIRESDLRAPDFEKALCILQCY